MNAIQTKNRSVITLQSLLFAATLFTASFTFAMKKDTPIHVDRTDLNYDNAYIKYPSIKVVEEQPAGKRYGVCHNYAISKKLKLKGQIPETLPIVGQDDWHTALQFTQKYCKEVSTPQKGDLVTYYPYNRSLLPTHSVNEDGMVDTITRKNHDDSFDITHTGLVHKDGIVKSKWGITPVVLKHPTFDVPAIYGNHVKYHRITEPTDEIIKDIKETIQNSNYKDVCTQYNKTLVEYAEQSNNDAIWSCSQYVMCTDIEASNAEEQSLIMIGAKKNNPALVQVAIQRNANLNKKDKNGKTALELAKENGHSSIVTMLEQAMPHHEKPVTRMTKPSKTAKESFWQTMNS